MPDTITITTTTVLGTGVFTWSPVERRTDRYGTCRLITRPIDPLTPVPAVPLDTSPVGRRGALVGVVTGQRESGHIGDLFRSIHPPRGGTPVGTEVKLGEGVLFRHVEDGIESVGIEPDDGRVTDWLDVHGLYRLHDQDVRLEFREGAA